MTEERPDGREGASKTTERRHATTARGAQASPIAPPPLWRRPITGAAILVLVLSTAAAFLRGVPFWLSASLVIGLGLSLLFGVLWEWSGALPSRRRAAILVATFISLGALAALGLRSGGPWWLLHPLASAALVAATLSLGNWLASELEKPGHLLPLCVIGALADLWSMLGGPTGKIGAETAAHVEAAAEALAHGALPPLPPWGTFLIYQWPQPGAGGMATLLGFGDLVFLALLLAGSRRFGLPLARVVALLTAGVALAMGGSLLWQRPIPALPVICGLFVLGNLPSLSLTRREWGITALFAALLGVLVLTAALWS